jgi:hypothetical protein
LYRLSAGDRQLIIDECKAIVNISIKSVIPGSGELIPTGDHFIVFVPTEQGTQK